MVARSCSGRVTSASIRSASTAPMAGRTSVWPVTIATVHTVSQARQTTATGRPHRDPTAPVLLSATQSVFYRYELHRPCSEARSIPLLRCVPVRLTAEQDALIRRAAEVEGTDLTNFTVTATLAHARDVLADRRLFMLDAPAWSEFVAVLDRPVSHKPRLEKLFAEPSIFDE